LEQGEKRQKRSKNASSQISGEKTIEIESGERLQQALQVNDEDRDKESQIIRYKRRRTAELSRGPVDPRQTYDKRRDQEK